MHKGNQKSRGMRINEAVKEEMAMILRDLKDPRIDLMTSVVKVDTSRDLKYCKIYVSVLGDDEKKADVTQALQAAASFIRRQLAQRLNLRNTPELTFLLDDSIEYSIYMGEKFKEIHAADQKRAQTASENEPEGEEAPVEDET